MPIADTKNPPLKHMAAVNIARRGPPSSTHRPSRAADAPRKKMPILKIHPSSVNFQSPGAGFVMPISLVIGRLKTLKA